MRTSKFKSETGSAAVEFVLLGVPMALVTLFVAQVLFVSYERNQLQDIAVEAAYFGALANQQPSDAEQFASDLAAQVNPNLQVETKIDVSQSGALRVLRLRLTSQTGLPFIEKLEVGAVAVLEIQQ